MYRNHLSAYFSRMAGIHLLLAALWGTILLQTGCLKKPALPSDNPAKLTLLICLVEDYSPEHISRASAAQISQVLIKLKNNKLTKEKIVDIGNNGSRQDDYIEISIPDLYPGTWEVDVFGLDHEQDTIFQGGEVVEIESGKTKQATIYLIAGPGRLNISFDASQIPEFGETIDSGRLYVYLDPTSNRSTSFPLTAEGTLLKGEAAIKEGTVSFKVAVPNVSGAKYISPYYKTDIEAGKTAYFLIRPDGKLTIITVIDSTPSTPEGLAINKDFPFINLLWNHVNLPDLAGYFVYRTDSAGRFVQIAQTDTTSYTDTISDSHFFDGKIGYAVSSFDQGGNESFWSSPQYVTKDEGLSISR